jgi:hypothetical protein
MTVHRPHPDSHTHGLADDCERCAEHAANPFEGLDERNLAELYRRVLNHERSRSENEGIAMHQVRLVANKARMLGMVMPAEAFR